MDLTQFAGLGAIPIVVAFVYLLKSQVFTPTTPPWAPVAAALAFSIFWCMLVAYALSTSLVLALVTSILVWLSSMGAWTGTKTILGR